ncbi:pyridoxamine 5'-phosphate oxidase family protein [Streptomyces roseicoloratus]|uniref:Pyridoxamine 5'-phosphate oxidase family protein n=1 Tax=Streptomyces roseicoloratus TaxID=2508722 RepID=A0ABY9RVD6_9ACTN|nr:pyridoxamine 5'-phosphate oxidase family protein [Streptomyces roseicoloratus]WMX46143.1 pyridoxamine 5'-phosphate oxidase family protein [Streptomyces roseicoloratus]
MSSEEKHAIELLNRVSYGRLATSMRAMPFVAPARHIVADGAVLVRLHRGLGYHRACNGSVVAYGADNLTSGAENLWSVQFTGTAAIVEPTEEQLAAFGRAPRSVDGEAYEPVYLRIEPQFVTVHLLDYSPDGTGQPERGGEPSDRPERAEQTERVPNGRSLERHLHHVA